jgi:hypothetical protein
MTPPAAAAARTGGRGGGRLPEPGNQITAGWAALGSGLWAKPKTTYGGRRAARTPAVWRVELPLSLPRSRSRSHARLLTPTWGDRPTTHETTRRRTPLFLSHD